nr:MAG: ORF1 [Torque teno midi virus]
MPFWWRRRRKPWFGKWRRRRYNYRTKRRKYRRKQYRRPAFRRRRRRRRRQKVRRKKQKIAIQQWQPDSITKCKIKGYGCLVAGAEGRQFYCYTNEIGQYIQPKAPGGGGFGAEMFSLEYLYKQWVARKNIWTHSNDYKDLVRYTGSKIKLFRHPTTDFIAAYNRQPPFLLEKDYYNDIHPANMLLRKHRKIIPSLKRKPLGKPYVTMKIKPPKQMITKWFFQREFAQHGLFTLEASACNLGWAYYGPNSQSRLLTFYALNDKFYQTTDWAKYSNVAWYPYPHYPTTDPLEFTYPKLGTQPAGKYKPQPTNYNESVNIDGGFFSWRVLTATSVNRHSGQHYAYLPITTCRYNPENDTGQGNAVWLTSVISNNNWEKPHDPDLVIIGKPLWMAFYGFYNYLQKVKQDKGWVLSGMLVCQSPAIQLITPHIQTIFPIIDFDFIVGKLPYGETITPGKKNTWYPTVEHQLVTINNFVETGPFIPKYSYLKESTWELTYAYTCYFKWGGPHVYNEQVQNPQTQGKYDVPDTITKTLQIADPLKQSYETMLRAWDYRRGIITTTALKRMSKHLQTDESIQSDDSEPTKKKKKTTGEIPYYKEETQEIQSCLLSLCEEDTFQETEDIRQLIHQQQQQQLKLKQNLIKLMIDLKQQQRALQLQTGFY